MKIIKKILGGKRQQKFWKLINKVSLLGMNIGAGAHIEESGEAWMIKNIKNKLGEKPIIFDVGANTGKYTEFMNNKLGEAAQIFSFEPSNIIFEELKNKFSNTKNVKLNNFGLGNTNKFVDLYTEDSDSGLSSIYNRRLDHFNKKMKNVGRIEIKTIDDFCENNNIDHIDFLKLDIEGNELNALHGAKKLLEKKKINYIQFEFGGCNIDSRTYFQDFYYLLNPDYNIYRILKNGLLPIKHYEETQEVFITTNYLAILR